MKKHRRKLIVLGAVVLVLGGAAVLVWLSVSSGSRIPASEYIRRFNELASQGMDAEASGGWDWIIAFEPRVMEADARLRSRIDEALEETDPPEGDGRFNWASFADPGAPDAIKAIIEREIKRLRKAGFFEDADEITGFERFPTSIPFGPDVNTASRIIFDRTSRFFRPFWLIELARFEISIRNGDAEEATEALQSCVAAASAAGQQPTVITRLIADAILHDIAKAVAAHAGLIAADAGFSESVSRLLSRTETLPGYSHAFEGDRILALAQIAEVETRASPIGSRFAGTRSAREAVETIYARAIELVSADHPPTAEDIEDLSKATDEVSGMAGLFVGTLEFVVARTDSVQTITRAARIQLALEAHRVAKGAYPQTLATLVPQFIEEIPNDPLAPDGVFRYRPSDRRFVLYSVGSDGIDNGGTPRPEREHLALTEREPPGFDYVFHAPE